MKRKLLVVLLSLSFAHWYAGAQAPAPAGATSDGADASADADWNEVATAFLSRTNDDGTPTAAKIKVDVGRADLAKNFYSKHSHDPRAGEARKDEILALVNADIIAGATSPAADVAARLRNLVDAYRADASVPIADRSLIGATYDFHRVGVTAHTADEAQAAFVSAARGLIREFPEQPQGYVSLLTLARGSDMPQAAVLVKELDKDATPPEVRTGALNLSARLDQTGEPLGTVVTLTAAEIAANDSGLPVVVYVWRANDPVSVAIATACGHLQTANAVWIGVNLDAAAGIGGAQAIVAANHFPGRQIYDGAGYDGPVARALHIDTVPLIITSDNKGKIQDVQAANRWDAKLTNLGL